MTVDTIINFGYGAIIVMVAIAIVVMIVTSR